MRMTYETGDQTQISNGRTVQSEPTEDALVSDSTSPDAPYKSNESFEPEAKQVARQTNSEPNKNHVNDPNAICYNPILDDEIRSRLNKLNSLSDLINSLERQFDEANSSFREILKCSTDRLSTIAKALGTKSIRQGRIYHAARLSVEQSQCDCQRACVQFEQANKEHQSAKKAIQDAESKLKEIAGQSINGVIPIPNINFQSIDLSKLTITNGNETKDESRDECDKDGQTPSTSRSCMNLPATRDQTTPNKHTISNFSSLENVQTNLDAQVTNKKIVSSEYDETNQSEGSSDAANNAAKLSEELNQAILKLFEAEKKRGQSEQLHLNQASKLMMAQENLMKLGREHGQSIRRSQLYFDEARRFDAKLNSVKAEICRISEDILGAKQAYAQTLKELEQFSDDLHVNSQVTVS